MIYEGLIAACIILFTYMIVLSNKSVMNCLWCVGHICWDFLLSCSQGSPLALWMLTSVSFCECRWCHLIWDAHPNDAISYMLVSMVVYNKVNMACILSGWFRITPATTIPLASPCLCHNDNLGALLFVCFFTVTLSLKGILRRKGLR